MHSISVICDELYEDGLELAAAASERASGVCHGEDAVLLQSDEVEGLDSRVGRLLEQRGQPIDVLIDGLEQTAAGSATIVKDRSLGPCRPAALEIMVLDGAHELEAGGPKEPRVLAACESLAQLGCGTAPIVGVERDRREDSAFRVYLGEHQSLNFHFGAFNRAHEVYALEQQPLTRARQRRPYLG